MKNLFILSYKGAKLVEEFIEKNTLTDTAIHIIDNGNQEWTSCAGLVKHRTVTNIGCAGGWNVICDIAFKDMELDTAIISNDDNIITDEMMDGLSELVNNDTIVGAYDRSFEFSLFAIKKTTYDKIGRFDENFIFVTCEDDDYKVRAKLNGVKVISLQQSADLNQNFTSRMLGTDVRTSNAEYIERKWGKNREYTIPFDNKSNIVPIIPRDVVIAQYAPIYGSLKILWPSEFEYLMYRTGKARKEIEDV